MIKQVEPGAQKKALSGQGEVSFKAHSGTVDSEDYEANLRVILDQNRTAQYLIGSYLYATREGEASKDSRFMHFRHLYAYQEPLIFELYSQIGMDDIRSLKERSLIGGGLRYRFFKTKNEKLYIGVGGFYEKRRYDNDATLKQTRHNVRGNFYLAYLDTLSKAVKAGASLYYQPVLEDLEDYYLTAEGMINVSLHEQLGLKLSVSHNEDTRPFEGNAKHEFEYKTTLTLRF